MTQRVNRNACRHGQRRDVRPDHRRRVPPCWTGDGPGRRGARRDEHVNLAILRSVASPRRCPLRSSAWRASCRRMARTAATDSGSALRRAAGAVRRGRAGAARFRPGRQRTGRAARPPDGSGRRDGAQLPRAGLDSMSQVMFRNRLNELTGAAAGHGDVRQPDAGAAGAAAARGTVRARPAVRKSAAVTVAASAATSRRRRGRVGASTRTRPGARAHARDSLGGCTSSPPRREASRDHAADRRPRGLPARILGFVRARDVHRRSRSLEGATTRA